LFPNDILPSGVARFSSPSDLLALAEAGPIKYYTSDRLLRISRHVREVHSFEARARVLLDDVRRHRNGAHSAP